MIYLAKFLHTTNQQEPVESQRRHGEFNMIVEAENGDAAVEKFRERIQHYRDTTDMFQGQCSIFLVHLLELQQFPREHARMLYYKSVAGDPVMPFISCMVPSGESDGCRILSWRGNRPEIDERDAHLFMQFEA